MNNPIELLNSECERYPVKSPDHFGYAMVRCDFAAKLIRELEQVIATTREALEKSQRERDNALDLAYARETWAKNEETAKMRLIEDCIALRSQAAVTEAKLAEAVKRLAFICRQAWETRQDSDNDPEYLYHIGLVAEINSGNYHGIDAAISATSPASSPTDGTWRFDDNNVAVSTTTGKPLATLQPEKHPDSVEFIKIMRSTDPNSWYASMIGSVLRVERHEVKRDETQGIPEDVYWCREGGTYNCLNYIRCSDAAMQSAQPKHDGQPTAPEIHEIAKRSMEFSEIMPTWVWHGVMCEWQEIDDWSKRLKKDTHWCHSPTKPTVIPKPSNTQEETS